MISKNNHYEDKAKPFDICKYSKSLLLSIHMHDRPLYFAAGSFFLIFFERRPREITARNSIEFCNMFESKLDWKMVIQNLGSLPQNVGRKNCLFAAGFKATS